MSHMYYIGVDYQLEVAVACIMGTTGNVVDKISLPATTEGMDLLMERMRGKRYKVLGEAFTYSMDLHYYLIGKGVDSSLVNPEELRLITKSYKKTDDNDCEAIAYHARGEIDLPMSYIVKDDEMRLRDLCCLRNDLSSAKSSTVQRIAAHMRRNGEYLPEKMARLQAGRIHKEGAKAYHRDLLRRFYALRIPAHVRVLGKVRGYRCRAVQVLGGQGFGGASVHYTRHRGDHGRDADVHDRQGGPLPERGRDALVLRDGAQGQG